jgi:hypothetical protein
VGGAFDVLLFFILLLNKNSGLAPDGVYHFSTKQI